MDIKSVISKHGYSVNSLAKEMGAWQSALNVVANGKNPTVGKLKEVAAAMGCSWLEFFADEVTAEDLRQAFPEQVAQLSAPAAAQPAAEPRGGEHSDAGASELPLGGDEQAPVGTALVGLVRCPQCGHSIRLFAEE